LDDDEEDEEGTKVELVGGNRAADDSGEGTGVAAAADPATVLGRAVGDISMEVFLANDSSLARGSFEDVEEAETESAPSSVFRFFCKLALRSASSSGSVSSRVSFFRFTLVFVVIVVVVVTGRVCFSSALSLSFSLSLSMGIVVLDIRIALDFLSWVCWIDAVEGGLECDSLGPAGVEGLVGVSTPSCADDCLTAFEAEPGCFLTGAWEWDAEGLDAGDSAGSFPFVLAAAAAAAAFDALAPSSFIWTSVFCFCASAFTLAFFSLISFDITPRFASSFDEEDGPPGVAFAVVLLDELTPAAEFEVGIVFVVLL
jgi:hypothetical protein